MDSKNASKGRFKAHVIRFKVSKLQEKGYQLKEKSYNTVSTGFELENDLKIRLSSEVKPKKNRYYNKDITLELNKHYYNREKMAVIDRHHAPEFKCGISNLKWSEKVVFKMTFQNFVNACGISLQFLEVQDIVYLKKIFLEKVQPVYIHSRVPFMINYTEQNLSITLKLAFKAFFYYFNISNPLFFYHEFNSRPRSQLLIKCVYLSGLRCLPRSTESDFLIKKFEDELDPLWCPSKLCLSLDTVQSILIFIMAVKWTGMDSKKYGLLRLALIMVKGLGVRKDYTNDSKKFIYVKEVELVIKMANNIDLTMFSPGTFFIPGTYIESTKSFTNFLISMKHIHKYLDFIANSGKYLEDNTKKGSFYKNARDFMIFITFNCREQGIIIYKETFFDLITNSILTSKQIYDKVQTAHLEIKNVFARGGLKIQMIINSLYKVRLSKTVNSSSFKEISELICHLIQMSTLFEVWFHFISLKLLDYIQTNSKVAKSLQDVKAISYSHLKFSHAKSLTFLVNRIHSSAPFVFYRPFLLFFASRFTISHIDLTQSILLKSVPAHPYDVLNDIYQALLKLKHNEFYSHAAISYLSILDSLLIRFQKSLNKSKLICHSH